MSSARLLADAGMSPLLAWASSESLTTSRRNSLKAAILGPPDSRTTASWVERIVMATRKEIHLALRGLLLTAVGLPSTRVFENVVPNPNPPPAGTPYVVEQNVPATSEVLSATMQTGAPRMNDGIYIAQYFAVDGSGTSTVGDAVDAILGCVSAGQSYHARERGRAPHQGQASSLGGRDHAAQ